MSNAQNYKFAGKTAFITGAGSGIGRATAFAFADAGANVAVVDINPTAAAETVKRIEESGGKATAIPCDVTNSDQVKAAVDRCVQAFGALNFAFNNAGIEQGVVPLTEVSEELFDRLFAINVKGVYLCMKHQIPVMDRSGGGVIINTASTAGVLSIRNQGSYCATKYAVVALSKSTALEVAGAKIRINALCPGITDTPMIERVSGGTPEGRTRLIGQEPVGRFARPEEMARATMWLCSDDGAFITGAALNIDGGQSAGIG
ncbi:glucose 1-dehydrogenase [Rhizobium leguminosarum]|uniref:glucose 1-dehydrogenase n=1 Tax=Rhizobium TaxID=379 RepID=UPI001C947617|nr:glucose 1-dehydrogenase [Rhizobium leguminosarum]MBY5392858.1 glucose 1-dehydrogenase [Rhizobium leguminosarum]MBY5434474.1 glucose 1-dehydrogenase [Rhizobium leguminosarum]MBY5768046.1 glucose 1-dehydrogenase [Rhizobium leguminosarum]